MPTTNPATRILRMLKNVTQDCCISSPLNTATAGLNFSGEGLVSLRLYSSSCQALEVVLTD
jgi:hypothetical protein